MNKIWLIAIAVCMLTVGHTTAQESTFQQNDNVVSLGVGIGGSYYGYVGFAGYSWWPTITFNYERCILGNLFNEQSALGIGAIGGFTYASHSSWTSTDIMIGLRGAFHYAFIDNLDTYAGAMGGYNIHSWKWKDSSDNLHSGGSGVGYGVFAGARYYFAGPIAVYAEFGYHYTLINAGISVKF
jgi:hypothetical protein